MTDSKLKIKIQLCVCTMFMIIVYGKTAYGNVLPEIQSASKSLFELVDQINNNTISRVSVGVLNNEATTGKPAEEE